jgi:ATP-dependent Lon protease
MTNVFFLLGQTQVRRVFTSTILGRCRFTMNRVALTSSATTLTSLSTPSRSSCQWRRTLLSSFSLRSLSPSLASSTPSLASRRYRTQCSPVGNAMHPMYPRTFSQSFSADARKTAVLGYPRWINSRTKSGEEAALDKKDDGQEDENAESSSSGESEGQSPPSSSSSPPSSSSSSSSPSGSSSGSGSNTIAKPSVPDVYPQVLALPIARRPLFPGFYKAVVIRNPHVVAAIKEMMKRGQPYLGAFLLKDDKEDADVITDLSKVYDVGVFAQITSIFSANAGGDANTAAPGATEEGLTAVLYPHRRIRITELVKAGETGPAEVKVEDIDAQTPTQTETPPPSPKLEPADVVKPSSTPSPPSPLQTSFLHNYPISIVNTVNLQTRPYPSPNTKEGSQSQQSQHIRAFMSEIISVFKDIAQLNPLFRDQITNFSINQVSISFYFSYLYSSLIRLLDNRSPPTSLTNPTNSPTLLPPSLLPLVTPTNSKMSLNPSTLRTAYANLSSSSKKNSSTPNSKTN